MATITKQQQAEQKAREAFEVVLDAARMRATEKWYAMQKTQIDVNAFMNSKPVNKEGIKLLHTIYQELFDFSMDWDGLDMSYHGTFNPSPSWIDWNKDNLGMNVKDAIKLLVELQKQGAINDLNVTFGNDDYLICDFELADDSNTILEDFTTKYYDSKRNMKELFSN